MAYNINEKCNGCTACAKLCPVFAITGEKGVRHIVNKERCIECGVCGKICQSSAITDAAVNLCTSVKRSQWLMPVINEKICSACSICVNDCTAGALSISLPQFKGDINVFAKLVHPKKCVGCGICSTHCPVGAISMEAAETGEKKEKCKTPVLKLVHRHNNNIKLPVYAKIDLDTGKTEPFIISEDYYRKYIGGKTLAVRLLLDLMPQGIDALAPAAVLIINTGPLNGTGAPSSSRFNMTFKNVLTGGIASSNCGGTFGFMMKRAGFDGLIITGRASKPSRIEIIDGVISIHSAEELWGLDTEVTQEKLQAASHGKLVIGPAGENLVRYACTASGERVAGRCGSGAVLGSKNIKALSAYGTKMPETAHPKKLSRFIKKWVRFIRNHPMTGDALPRYGTAGLVNKANATGALPSRNFRFGSDPDADAVSGETLAETELTRNSGCISCPIRCERRVKKDAKGEDTGHEIKGPEYETAGFFGPNIGAKNLRKVIDLNYICDALGMDTISAASTIAFAMELKEKGLADFDVEFGNTDNLEEALRKIAFREGIYSDLANGSKWMSEKYGGKEFAMHSKGLEMASYEPRRSVGMGLGYATSNRGGCHLGGGYLALLESIGVLSTDAQSPAKAELAIFMQDALEAVSASGFCLFTAQTFVPSIFFNLGPNHFITRLTGKIATHAGGAVRLLLGIKPLLRFNSFFLLPHAEALRLTTGFPIYTGSFLKFGERGFNLERLFNLREGLTSADDSLPDRLTKTPQPLRDGGETQVNPKHTVPLEKMLKQYYKVRGWDAQGIPKKRTLKRLGLECK
jgi:aldehyde:ferredoxin oxidoreductase